MPITTDKLLVKSVDFVGQYTKGVKSLLDVLGITNIQQLNEGSEIKFYKMELDGTAPSDAVNEGDEIPLTEFKRTEVKTEKLKYRKRRKVTTMEAIQNSGFDMAVSETNTALIRILQNSIKADLFKSLQSGTLTVERNSISGVFAAIEGQLASKFEDTLGVEKTVVLINPLDLEKINATIGKQAVPSTIAGVKIFKDIMGVDILMTSNAIPENTVVATPSNNLRAFKMNKQALNEIGLVTDDESGFIGVGMERIKNKTSVETVAVSGYALFPEYLDGVFVGKINPTATPTA